MKGLQSQPLALNTENAASTLNQLNHSSKELQTTLQSVGGMQKTTAEIQRTESAAKQATTAAKHYTAQLTDTGKSSFNIFSKLEKTLQRVALRMLAYRALSWVLTAVADGLRNIAQINSEANATLSQLSSSLNYLKNSIASAFLPVLQAITPVLVKIIDAAATLFNLLGALFARLTGQKTYQAATKTMTDFAGSLESTAGAAQKAYRYLAPFDELNVMDGESGGSSSNSPLGNTMQLQPIELEGFSLDDFPPFAKLCDWLSTAKEYVYSFSNALGDLKSKIGELFPFKLPEWLTNPIPAPTFEPLSLPNWATALLPVPQWTQNPILAPVLNASPLLSGVSALQTALDVNAEAIEARFSKIGGYVYEALHGAQTKISESLTKTTESINGFTTNTLPMLTSWGKTVHENFSITSKNLRESVSSGLTGAMSAIAGFAKNTSDNITSWGTNVMTNSRAAFSYFAEISSSALSASAKNFADWINNTSGNVAAWGNSLIGNIASTMKGWYSNFVSGLSAAWESFTGFMKATGEKVSEWWSANKNWAAPVAAAALTGAGVAAVALSGGISIPAVASLSSLTLSALPALASGGVLRSPTAVLAGEYPGAQHNPEIIAPQNTMIEAVRSANGDFVSVFIQIGQAIVTAIEDNKETTVVISRDTIGENAVKYINDKKRCTGRSPV